MKTLALLFLTALPATAQDLPPGLVSAELLPGWVTPEGERITALRLELEPGWKTYWRSPGDAGVPPRFDWAGSDNLAQALPLWPRPEVIDSAGERTLGYHDELLLPVAISPVGPGPVVPRAVVDFGLCLDICVPAQVTLQAPPPGDSPDPRITAAIARQPRIAPEQPECRVEPIADGMRVTALLPGAGPADADVTMEPANTAIWVSAADLSRDTGMLVAQADFVDASGKPFALDLSDLRLTLIGVEDAVEYRGCRRAGN